VHRPVGIVVLAAALLAACGGSADSPNTADRSSSTTTATVPTATSEPRPPALLVFTRTTGFRHASIEQATVAVRGIADAGDMTIDVTEDPAVFTDANLRRFGAVAFLMTTGDVLDDEQQGALERFVRGGGGFAGVHSATDTEYDWPFYGELVGAYFARHPAIQEGTLTVEDRGHPSTVDLPPQWSRTDEWYDFRTNPRPTVHVLVSVDESTYAEGGMGADHPISWFHDSLGGRAWYTAMGHTEASYAEPEFLSHLRGGLLWVMGMDRPT